VALDKFLRIRSIYQCDKLSALGIPASRIDSSGEVRIIRMIWRTAQCILQMCTSIAVTSSGDVFEFDCLIALRRRED